MSEELKFISEAECFEEFYGVDGDGLCESEIASEGEQCDSSYCSVQGPTASRPLKTVKSLGRHPKTRL